MRWVLIALSALFVVPAATGEQLPVKGAVDSRIRVAAYNAEQVYRLYAYVGYQIDLEFEPGETYVYEFTLRQHGTLMYHPHSDEMVQLALGMMGFLIVHPRAPEPAPAAPPRPRNPELVTAVTMSSGAADTR